MRTLETIASQPLTGRIAELMEEHADPVARAHAFYQESLKRAFKGSTAMLANGTYHRGRNAMDALDAKSVKPFLAEAVLGKFESAKSIGEQAMVRMWTVDPSGAVSPQEWWRNLLDYEYALFLQLASDFVARTMTRPIQTPSATLRSYSWDIRGAITNANNPDFKSSEFNPKAFEGKVQHLLFSRNSANEVHITELTIEEAAVFMAVNGKRSPLEIAQECGVEEKIVRSLLQQMAQCGAILSPTTHY
jgi:hypothetical protein